MSRQPYRAGGQQPFGGAEPPLNEPCGLVGDAKSAEGEVQPFFQQIYPSGSDVRFHVHSGKRAMNVGKIDAITSSASSGDTLKRTVPFGSASVRKAACWAWCACCIIATQC